MAKTTSRHLKALDRDLRKLGTLELAAQSVVRPYLGLGFAVLFLLVIGTAASAYVGIAGDRWMLVIAAVFAGYMALNIGANDVANNIGPAVGANVISLGGALVLAAVAEIAGAILAGGNVVQTLSSGVFAQTEFASPAEMALAMIAALLASALWLNIATWLNAPVSTTHSIVGAIMGAGVLAGGLEALNWPVIGQIALSWLIAPVLGGLGAALMLAFLTQRVLRAQDQLRAARVWLPRMIGMMAASFASFVGVTFPGGLPAPTWVILVAALGVGALCAALAAPLVTRAAGEVDGRKRALRKIFGLPLVAAAALLSFAHGANDVSNAVAPLAAIHQALSQVPSGEAPPLWIMLIGAFGISLGLLTFGRRLVRLVGGEITKLNPARAFCIAVSTAMTVIVASWIGMPVSSTHIAVGAVFGVGFYREWDAARQARRRGESEGKSIAVEEFRRRRLVRRSYILTLMTAWSVTMPLSALLAAGVFAVLRVLGT